MSGGERGIGGVSLGCGPGDTPHLLTLLTPHLLTLLNSPKTSLGTEGHGPRQWYLRVKSK